MRLDTTLLAALGNAPSVTTQAFQRRSGKRSAPTWVKVHSSARRCGIPPDRAIQAAEGPVSLSDLDDDSPLLQLRLAFDAARRLLEIVVLRCDSGHEVLIHAMNARRQCLDPLDWWGTARTERRHQPSGAERPFRGRAAAERRRRLVA